MYNVVNHQRRYMLSSKKNIVREEISAGSKSSVFWVFWHKPNEKFPFTTLKAQSVKINNSKIYETQELM